MRILALTLFLLSSVALAGEKISYSGRLVQPSNGAPLSGPVSLTFDILVDDSVRCSLNFPTVNLANGVFNVEFDYATTCDGNTKNLSSIISESVTGDKKLEIRVTEGSNTYTAQKVNSTPLALVAQKAMQVEDASIELRHLKITSGTCDNGKVLKFDASGNLTCATDISGASGTVTDVNSGIATNVTNPTTSPAINVLFDDVTVGVNVSNELEVKNGSITNAKLGSDIDASKITAGSIADARIPLLDASKIGSGTFPATRLDDLDAAKITTGVFAIARIPSITSAMIADGTIQLSDFAAECLPGQILKYQAGPIFVACGNDDNTNLWTENSGDVYRATGDVGIGTTTPSARLTIKSSMDTVDGGIKMESTDGAKYATISLTNAGDLRFYNNSSSVANSMRLTETGNVGIGLSTPSKKLDVNGGIKGTELCIGADCRTAWPSNTTGTVTNIATGAGLTGGPITSTGTISVATGGITDTMVASGISASKLTTGTLPDAQLSSNVTKLGSTIENSEIVGPIDWAKISKTGAVASDVGAVPTARTVTAGTGLTGGGALSSDITLNADPTAINYWIKSTNDLYYNTGKVAIGTTSIENALTIAGADHQDDGPIIHLRGSGINQVEGGRIRFTEGNGTYQGTYIHYDASSTNLLHIGAHDSSDKDITKDINALTIRRNNGYVGIGTDTPEYRLHVENNPAIINSRSSDNVNGSHLQLRKSRGTVDARTIVQNNDEIFTLWGQGYDGDQYHNVARIVGHIDGVPGDNDMPGRLEFRTTPDNSTIEQTRMVIKSDGKIGIATVTPTQALDVNGTVKATAFIGDGSGLTGLNASSSSNTGNAVITADSDANATGDILFNTGASTKMTIKNDGKIGIGTTSPSSMFHISGTTPAMDFTDTDTGVDHSILAQSANGGFNIQVDKNNENALSYFGVQVGGVDTLRINKAGDTGIGTNTPTDARLHVFKTTSMGSIGAMNTAGAVVRIQENATGPNMFFDGNTIVTDHQIMIGNTVAQPMSLFTNDTKRMTITATGDVGIGTESPSADLEVIGVARVSNATGSGTAIRLSPAEDISALNPGTTTTNGGVIQGPTNASFIMDLRNNNTDDAFAIRYSSGNTASVDSIGLMMNGAGNVGIGTTTPSAKLEVKSSTGSTRLTGEGVEIYRNPATTPTDTAGYIDFKDNTADDYDMRLHFNSTLDGMSFKSRANLNIMQIGNNGKVGIGVAAPSEQLEVANNVKATSYLTTSDRRLKKNIHPIDSALDKVLRLRGVSFVWKKNDLKTYGFIAQEVEEIFPELVVTDETSGYKAVKYANLVAPVVEAVKELNDKVEGYERKIASLEEENEVLKEKIELQNKAMQSILERLDNLEKGQ
ncbi:endosialidase chaperone [Bacteriovorax sp. BSW11_IV]|nr:endosialidase chaperone [Bacteriovorax sp. BSW11_IV]